MAGLLWNNSVVNSAPSVGGSAQGAAVVPTVTPLWGSFSYGHADPWWPNRLNCISASWLNNIYVYRQFPRTIVGDVDRSAAGRAVFALGNVLDDVLEVATILNTYRAVASYTNGAYTGSRDGINFTAPNASGRTEPPTGALPDPLAADIPTSGSVPPGGELPFDIAVDGQDPLSTVALEFCADWSVATPPALPTSWEQSSLCLVVQGQRAVVIAHLPLWGDSPPKINWFFPDDVFVADSQLEQRTSALDAVDLADPTDCDCIHELSAQFGVDGLTDDVRLWQQLIQAKHRRCALPFWFEPLQTTTDPAGLTTIALSSFDLDYLMFESSEIVLIDRETRAFETRRVVSVDRAASEITVDQPWALDVPWPRAVFHFVIYAVPARPSVRTWRTDSAQLVECFWESIPS